MSEIETWLDEIQKRCEEASPAPWRTDTVENVGENWLIGAVFNAGVAADDEGHEWIVTTDRIHASEMMSGGAQEDAEFIAHARTDLPSLLALVRHYREALAEGLACLRLAADTARIHGNERLTVTLDNACRQVSAALEAMPHD